MGQAPQPVDPVTQDINQLHSDYTTYMEMQGVLADEKSKLEALLIASKTMGNCMLAAYEIMGAMTDYTGDQTGSYSSVLQVQTDLGNLNTDGQSMLNDVSSSLEGEISPTSGGGNNPISQQMYSSLQAIQADLGANNPNTADITKQITAMQTLMNANPTFPNQSNILTVLSNMASNNNPAGLGNLGNDVHDIYSMMNNGGSNPQAAQLMAIYNDIQGANGINGLAYYDQTGQQPPAALMQQFLNDINNLTGMPTLQGALKAGYNQLANMDTNAETWFINSNNSLIGNGNIGQLLSDMLNGGNDQFYNGQGICQQQSLSVFLFASDPNFAGLQSNIINGNWSAAINCANALINDLNGSQYAGFTSAQKTAMVNDLKTIAADLTSPNNPPLLLGQAMAAFCDLSNQLFNNGSTGNNPTPPPVTPPTPTAQQLAQMTDMVSAYDAMDGFIANHPDLFSSGGGGTITAQVGTLGEQFGNSWVVNPNGGSSFDPTGMVNAQYGFLVMNKAQGQASPQIQQETSTQQSIGQETQAMSSSSRMEADYYTNNYKQELGTMEDVFQLLQELNITAVHGFKST